MYNVRGRNAYKDIPEEKLHLEALGVYVVLTE
jgi:hypothetical protein